MTPLRILAVDDEPLALERLRELIEREPNGNLIAVASGVAAAIEHLKSAEVDLLLLDIKMRDGTAFDLLEQAEMPVMPLIAFVTAYPRFAHRAFDCDAIDYLLKPVAAERLRDLLAKAERRREQLSVSQKLEEYEQVIRQLREDRDERAEATFDREFWIPHRGRERARIAVDKIDFITAEGDYAAIHAEGHEYLLRLSLDRLMLSLDASQFARIHRSTIVRIDRVASISRKAMGVREAALNDGTRLAIGRVFAKKLKWWNGPISDR